VKDQRRQRKIIDQLRLVAAITEVGNIVGVRYIGFCDELNIGRDFVEHSPH
jgi:hypothetical protein